MGVPGLVAWVLLQAVFAVSVFRVYMRQSESESEKWIRPMAGVVLVFWLAVMVNSSFDVYLEGPQGGIWFWSVFGLGLALIGFDRANRGTRLRETGHDGLPG
jgi:protein-S-isoprenylcysteine O-methyltransferase Ste14